jgi:hypothetical protein
LLRWIFILEGILTVLVAILAYFVLHDFPETATFLTEEERAFVVYRLKYQGASDETVTGVRVAQDDSFQWKFVKSAFLDWQIWTNIWVYWGMWMAESLELVVLETDETRHRMPSIWNLPVPAINCKRVFPNSWFLKFDCLRFADLDILPRLHSS